MPVFETRLLLMRHAETAVPEVFHGAESDVGLSTRGQAQAEAIAPVLAAERPVAVISSAMQRAIRTATPIAIACGVTLRTEPLLHERRVGGLSGRPFDDTRWPETVRRWKAGETAFATEGAESFDDIRNRVMPVWLRLAEEYAGRTAVVVAHGTVNKVLILSLQAGLGPADWDHFRSLNLGIHELVVSKGQWRILRLADLPEAVRQVGISTPIKS